MTIEEKAKAYDEAKSIMGKYLKSGNAGVIAENTIKKAFPEIEENEDERIRKEIIRVFKGEISFTSEKANEKYIAWLEKQGKEECALKSFKDEKDTKQYKLEDKVTIDGIEGYVLEVDNTGEPTVLCSEFLGHIHWDDAMKKANQGLWHLPTVDEFDKYYEVVRELDGGKGHLYWTSKEDDSVYARFVNTDNGYVSFYNKAGSNHVRAFAYVGKKKDIKPRSWEEYCEQVKNTECYSCVQDSVMPYSRVGCPQYNEFDSKEDAKAFIALGKLIQLHKAWVKDWSPDWTGDSCKYNIQPHNNKIVTILSTASNRVLTFPTQEMRDEFLVTFRDLIEEAKPLL